jgi:hypothetical protein
LQQNCLLLPEDFAGFCLHAHRSGGDAIDLEVRSPFLSLPLVEFAFVPVRFKMKNANLKVLCDARPPNGSCRRDRRLPQPRFHVFRVGGGWLKTTLAAPAEARRSSRRTAARTIDRSGVVRRMSKMTI